MLKKVMVLVVGLMLVATYCFAQNPRYSPYDQKPAGKTQFTSITVSGTDDKIPGVVEMRGAGADSWRDDSGNIRTGSSTDANSLYYLWVDDVGKLRICSYTTISSYTSFPNVKPWNGGQMPGCAIVGSQS